MPLKPGASTKLKPMLLPPVKTLRVRHPNQGGANPCLEIMSSMLTCWASNGLNGSGCAGLETQLRKCMDGPPAPKTNNSHINYHLQRLHPRIVQPVKKVERWREKL